MKFPPALFTRSARRIVTGALFLGSVLGALPAAAPAGYTLIWEDLFDGSSLDTNLWLYRKGNTSQSAQRPENVSVSGGTLNLALKRENFGTKGFTGGGIISKRTFRYGYYEASVLTENSSGWHQAFWAMGINPGFAPAPDYVGPNNQVIELDGIEIDGGNPNEYHTNWHEWFPSHVDHGWSNINHLDFTTGFQVIGFEYLPDRVRFFYQHPGNGSMVEVDNNTGNLFNSAKTASVNVWLTAIAKTTPSASFISGMTKFGYFRFYAKKHVGANLVSNPGFDFDVSQSPYCWEEASPTGTPEASRSQASAPHSAPNRLLHQHTASYQVTTKQSIDGLVNGSYTLRAWVKASSGLTMARMRAVDFGGSEDYENAPATNTWTQITLTDIPVSNNRCVIAFTSSGSGGSSQYFMVDDVEFFAQ